MNDPLTETIAKLRELEARASAVNSPYFTSQQLEYIHALGLAAPALLTAAERSSGVCEWEITPDGYSTACDMLWGGGAMRYCYNCGKSIEVRKS